MHINEEMTPPSQLVNGIPPQLEQVVMKATKKYQTERYSNADEMLEALENVEHIHSILGKLIYTGTRQEGAGSPDMGGQDHFLENLGDGNHKKGGMKSDKAKDTGGNKKKRWTQSKTLAILLALIIALPLSFGIYQLISNGGVGANEFEMPDYTGMLLEEVEAMAGESGLQVETGDIVYSDEHEEGRVVSQTPAPTTKVKEGGTVTVNLSRGSREGTVPNIVSKTYQDAVFFLEKYGYKVGSVSYENANQPEGLVLRQSPTGGEEAAPGSFVNFVVSLGVSESQAIVPLLVGMTELDATEALQAVNLTLGDVTIEKNDTVAEGLIFWQSQGADTVVQGGTSINVKISGVPEDPNASYSIPLHVDFTQASNEVFYLTIVISDESGTHNVLSNAQRAKSDGGGTVTLSGVGEGTVAVIFDTTEVARYQVNFRTGELF
jgi:serine/threonine-protein kinase